MDMAIFGRLTQWAACFSGRVERSALGGRLGGVCSQWMVSGHKMNTRQPPGVAPKFGKCQTLEP